MSCNYLRRAHFVIETQVKRVALEVNKVANLHIEGASNATKNVNANVSPAAFQLPEIGTARARHERKLALRDVLVLAQLPYTVAKAPLLRFVIHGKSVWWLYFKLALYREPFQLATEKIGSRFTENGISGPIAQMEPARIRRAGCFFPIIEALFSRFHPQIQLATEVIDSAPIQNWYTAHL